MSDAEGKKGSMDKPPIGAVIDYPAFVPWEHIIETIVQRGSFYGEGRQGSLEIRDEGTRSLRAVFFVASFHVGVQDQHIVIRVLECASEQDAIICLARLCVFIGMCLEHCVIPARMQPHLPRMTEDEFKKLWLGTWTHEGK